VYKSKYIIMINDRILLEQAYSLVQETFNPTPEQTLAMSRLDNNGRNILTTMLDFLSKGARKAAFFYTSETTGRVAVYNVNLGVNYGNIKTQSQELINRHIESLPAGHADRETASGINTRTVSYFYRINFPSGISVGMKTPKLPKSQLQILKNDPAAKEEYINTHLDQMGLYIMGTVDKSQEIEPARKQRTVSAAQQLQKDLGTRQSKIASFFLRPKNIANLAIGRDSDNKGIIKFQDTVNGDPMTYLETQDQPEDQPQEPTP